MEGRYIVDYDKGGDGGIDKQRKRKKVKRIDTKNERREEEEEAVNNEIEYKQDKEKK